MCVSVRLDLPGFAISLVSRVSRFEPAQVEFPEIEEGLQPRHRFMSAYEQKVRRRARVPMRVPMRGCARACGRCPPGRVGVFAEER
jgi:hypothetical protein